MKIQIVGAPRSGTTSLLDGICEQNYKRIGEPFNYSIRIKDRISYPIPDLETDENICVKCITSQTPTDRKFDSDDQFIKEYGIELNEGIKDRVIMFQKEFCKKFDKVILLDRANDTEHWKSYQNLIQKLEIKKQFPGNNPVFSNWYDEEITQEITDKLVELGWRRRFDMEKDWIAELSNKLNIPITHYEDLYGEDRIHSFEIINKWELDLDPFKLNEYLHPKYKLKQPGKKPII